MGEQRGCRESIMRVEVGGQRVGILLTLLLYEAVRALSISAWEAG